MPDFQTHQAGGGARHLMRRHATDLQEDASLATQDSTDVFIEGLSEAVLDQGDASLRGEDDVVEEVCEAGGHNLLSPLRGCAEFWWAFPWG